MERQLRKDIIDFLSPLPSLHTENGRRAAVLTASLDPILVQTDLSGNPQEAITLLVNVLEQYGKLDTGEPALAWLLQAIKTQVGADKQQILQGFCDRLAQSSENAQAFVPPEKPMNGLSDDDVRPQAQKLETTPQQPSLGPIVYKLCNREDQENAFLKFFQAKRKDCPRQPQFYFLHGEEGECHESFIERIEKVYLKKYVARAYGEHYADIYSRNVSWPSKGTLETRKDDLLFNFIKRFGDLETTPADLANTLSQLLLLQKHPVVVVTHNISASQWDLCNEQLILWYITECWGNLKCHEDLPQFLIFLNIIYPPMRSITLQERIFSWKHVPKKRIIAHLEQIDKSTGDPDPCALFHELDPVTKLDVQQWFSSYNIYDDEWRRKEKLDLIFEENGKVVKYKNMADIERHLKTIIEEYQQARSE